MSLMSSTDILRCIENGSVVIDPFDETRLNTNSYDLELGPNFWRYSYNLDGAPREVRELKKGKGFRLEKWIDGIYLRSKERVLGHSIEVAGGTISRDKKTAVTTSLQATSTAARHGITACMCAGLGDCGFINRWTFEIENRTEQMMYLPVGAIIAQVCFHELTTVPDKLYGREVGQYQHEHPWTPEDMLPGPLKVLK